MLTELAFTNHFPSQDCCGVLLVCAAPGVLELWTHANVAPRAQLDPLRSSIGRRCGRMRPASRPPRRVQIWGSGTAGDGDGLRLSAAVTFPGGTAPASAGQMTQHNGAAALLQPVY